MAASEAVGSALQTPRIALTWVLNGDGAESEKRSRIHRAQPRKKEMAPDP
jgi:hypothetical protein